MSRRYIRESTIEDNGKVVPQVVAVVSTGDNLQQENDSQSFFKRNYLEALRKVIPPFYFSEEIETSGEHVSYPNQVINSYCQVLKNLNTLAPVSALPGSYYLSSIDTAEGFSRFIYKQNNPTRIKPFDFELQILHPLGKAFGDFSTSAEFYNYITEVFLPSIPIQTPATSDNLATLTASAFSADSSGTHAYLIDNLGWLYFLNKEAPSGGNFSPSAAVGELITTNLWRGRSIELVDALLIFQEYLWKNYAVLGIEDEIIPADYLSSTYTETQSTASGTQLLDALKTINAVVFSPEYLNSNDKLVKDTLINYISTSSMYSDGILISDTESNGPLTRLLEAISFSMGDRVTEGNELGIIYDISKCPEELLEPLAELIGWDLLGADPDRWRIQLLNAVSIYKAKGTKKSILTLLDTLFSPDVFNITDSNLFELWESYLPDLIYYSLATSSPLFKDFSTYTPRVAAELGIATYNATSMDTNIRIAVDKVLFDLVREFPDNFYLGGRPFPAHQFYKVGTERPYFGPYHIRSFDRNGRADYWTGAMSTDESQHLELRIDQNFLFRYRDRTYFVPPFEKRQYYTQSYVTRNLLSKLSEILSCLGMDQNFLKRIMSYIEEYSTGTIETARILNNFLLFSKKQTFPPNYEEVLRDVTKERLIDPITLLSLWNGKSSHFLVTLEASSFDWQSKELNSKGPYGLGKVYSVINTVAPAHAIPEVLLTVSSVSDNHPTTDNACEEIRPNFYDLYEGSGDVTNNFAGKAVNMTALAVANGIVPNRFLRAEVDNVNDVLLSGTTFSTTDYRNSLRRRSFRHLLPETKMFTRIGRNNPGSLELSSPYYFSAIGYMPLGYVPSSLDFTGVALKTNPNRYGIGELLDRANVHPIWAICENLNSSSSYFGYDVSNTFASRAKQNVASSDCNSYGRRGQLPEILALMNSLKDRGTYLQASSMVSGYVGDRGLINRFHASSNALITPMDFSAWYANTKTTASVVKSIGNYLINQQSADSSIKYYEHFKFGRNIHLLYSKYISLFGKHGTLNNFNLLGGPNIFSHTFGPFLYNSNLEVDGSAIDTSSFLQASSALYETDISYYGGSGVLSIAGSDVGSVVASDSTDLYIGNPEFRNSHLVSAMQLVDTSTSYLYEISPIFSIFKLARTELDKYNFESYVIGNTIIKYHRPPRDSSFPRLKIDIDNSVATNKARNFLEPDHEYEVKVTAHNLDISSTAYGGLTLSMWVHTQSERRESWSYLSPRNACVPPTWEAVKDSSFNSTGGEARVKYFSQPYKFPRGELTDLVQGAGDGGGMSLLAGARSLCQDVLDTGDTAQDMVPGSNPRAIVNIGEDTKQVFTFRFSTYNKHAIPSNEYRQSIGNIHRTDQKYSLEFFIPEGSPTQFIVFEDIEIVDLTNNNMAEIETDYGNLPIDESEVRTVFRYFGDLQKGIASRNSSITSGTMEVSGGSRMNYRSNVEMYYNSYNTGYDQLQEVHIEDR